MGFYVDLDTQTVGFGDRQKHLEFLQIRLIHFLLVHPDRYITSKDIDSDPDIFSINLSKYIYEIKNKSTAVIAPSVNGEERDRLFEQILDKKTVNGKRGYRLRIELTDYDINPGTEQIITDTDSEAVNLPPELPPTHSPSTHTSGTIGSLYLYICSLYLPVYFCMISWEYPQENYYPM